MLAEQIKMLRENMGMTQSDLARKLGITRSGVNGWEMGLSVPSTQYIVELAKTFHVSTDLLLGVSSQATIHVDNLSDEELQIVHRLVEHFRAHKKGS